MRRVFKDEQLQLQFERDGYVIVPFLNEREVAELTEKYHTLPSVDVEGFYSSIHVPLENLKRKSHDLLVDYGFRVAKEFLYQYKPLVGNFIYKTPGEKSQVPNHQDWSFLDEHKYYSINAWCPLVDVNKHNGTIYLFKGSDRLAFTIRGTLTPSAFEKVDHLIDFETLTYLPMKAGEVLLYDHQMVHASPPNQSDKNRLAFAIAMIPQEAQALHFYQNPETGKLEKYEVGVEFFMDYTYGNAKMPASAKYLEVVEGYSYPQITDEQIAPLIGKPARKGSLFQRFIEKFNL